MLKRLLLVCTWALLCFTPAHATGQANEVVILTDSNFKPYAYVENDQAVGIYINILKAIAKRMKEYNIALAPIDWSTGVSQIKQGDAPLLMGVWYRPTSRPSIWPYSTPVFQERTAVYCRNSFTTNRQLRQFPDDFKGARLANNTGFDVGGDKLKKMIKEGEITLNESRTTEDNLQKVLTNEADCYANDKLAVRVGLKSLSQQRKFIGAPDVNKVVTIQRENSHLGISKPYLEKYPEQAAFYVRFLQRFNEEIEIMARDGEIEAIVNLYLSTH